MTANEFTDRSLDNLAVIHKLDTYMTGHKGFIAGGCFKNIIDGQDIRDVDIYFLNEADWAEADSYYKGSDNYVFSYENDKVRAYKNKYSKIRVELIRVMFGTPEEVIGEFDFTVTKFAYYKQIIPATEDEDETTEYRVVHHKDFFEHLHMKRLVVDDKIIRPGSTFERTYKYRSYGFNLCRESKVKIIEALRSPDFNPEDLSQSLYDGMD